MQIWILAAKRRIRAKLSKGEKTQPRVQRICPPLPAQAKQRPQHTRTGAFRSAKESRKLVFVGLFWKCWNNTVGEAFMPPGGETFRFSLRFGENIPCAREA